MKLKLLIFIMLCFWAFSGAGSAQTRKTVTPNFVTELPATCNSNLSSQTVYIVKNDAQYICKNNVFEKLGAGNHKGAFAKASLPTVGVSAGDYATVTDSTKGQWRYNGSNWIPNEAGRKINMLDFCNPATTSDCTTQIQAAVGVLNNLGGGTLVFPAGYSFQHAFPILMVGYKNITFEGTNTGRWHTATLTNLRYTGAGATTTNAYDLRSSVGVTFRNMSIRYSNVNFLGIQFEFGHGTTAPNNGDSQQMNFINCVLGGTEVNSSSFYDPAANHADNAAAIIDFGHAIIGTVKDSHFVYAKKGILGISAVKGWSYVFLIENNVFNYVPIALWNVDSLWRIVGNTFEPDLDGKLVAMDSDNSDYYMRSITFTDNYIGDQSAAQTTPYVSFKNALGGIIARNWMSSYGTVCIKVSGSEALEISGNRFETNAAPTTAVVLDGSVNANRSITIKNNSMQMISGITKIGVNIGGVEANNPVNGLAYPNIYGGGFSVKGDELMPSNTSGIDFGYKSSLGVGSQSAQIGVLDAGIGEGGYSLGYLSPNNGETAHVWYTFTGSAYAKRLKLNSAGLVTSVPLSVGTTASPGTPVARWKNGRCTLVAGACTVSDASVTANTNIFIHRQNDGGTISASYSITRTAGTSFTITGKTSAPADNTADTSVLAWQMLEP